MTRFFFMAALAVFVFAGSSFTVANHNGDVVLAKVDLKQSTVTWQGYKVTGKHNGLVNLKNGNLEFKNGLLTGGSFEIDMNSIVCSDLSGEWKDKLEGHLKSDDFFGVKSFPTAKFVITKAVSKGTPGSYKIVGNLTIKETTKEIKFETNLVEQGNNVVATADIKIDRSDFNVRYGSGSFFDNLGDKTIYDEFDLGIKLVAIK